MPNFPIETYLAQINQKRQTDAQRPNFGQSLGTGLQSGMVDEYKNQTTRYNQIMEMMTKDKTLKKLDANGQPIDADANDWAIVANAVATKQGLPPGYVFETTKQPATVPLLAFNQETGTFTNQGTAPKGAIVKNIGSGKEEKETYFYRTDQAGNIKFYNSQKQEVDSLPAGTIPKLLPQTETDKISGKKADLSNELNIFFELESRVPRASGAGRFGQGFKNVASGFTQSGESGPAIASYDGAIKRLRVKLVRAAGDVGNIAVPEQEAAEKIIPTKWDSAEVATIKRAYLKELSRALESKNTDELRKVLDKAGVSYTNMGAGTTGAEMPIAPQGDLSGQSTEELLRQLESR